MIRRPSLFLSPRKTATYALLFALALGGAEWTTPSPAEAQVKSDDTLGQEKAYWQNRYRTLLKDQARLRKVVESETELYADANRRNYRRGPVRHEHRAKALEAQEELSRVEEELAGFEDEARRRGALPGWLYEVEAETISISETPATPDPNAARDDDDDRDGRNPLFDENDDRQ